jgi:hypothetical protein
MHESAATTISEAFTASVKDLVSHAPSLSRCIKVRTNGDVPYAGGGGLYVPDLSIRVLRENVFHVEVAFSQSYADVRSKIANILQNQSILGVLLVKIKEMPKWSMPGRNPGRDDRMLEDDWFAELKWDGNFGALSNQGIIWMNVIKVEVSLFEKGWDASGSDPVMV